MSSLFPQIHIISLRGWVPIFARGVAVIYMRFLSFVYGMQIYWPIPGFIGDWRKSFSCWTFLNGVLSINDTNSDIPCLTLNSSKRFVENIRFFFLLGNEKCCKLMHQLSIFQIQFSLCGEFKKYQFYVVNPYRYILFIFEKVKSDIYVWIKPIIIGKTLFA